jgi:hypothetical protein
MHAIAALVPFDGLLRLPLLVLPLLAAEEGDALVRALAEGVAKQWATPTGNRLSTLIEI